MRRLSLQFAFSCSRHTQKRGSFCLLLSRRVQTLSSDHYPKRLDTSRSVGTRMEGNISGNRAPPPRNRDKSKKPNPNVAYQPQAPKSYIQCQALTSSESSESKNSTISHMTPLSTKEVLGTGCGCGCIASWLDCAKADEEGGRVGEIVIVIFHNRVGCKCKQKSNNYVWQTFARHKWRIPSLSFSQSLERDSKFKIFPSRHSRPFSFYRYIRRELQTPIRGDSPPREVSFPLAFRKY